jgi:EAL domain-containing protein (putative c-di-GMP-specific phosphodiesterase class I)
MSGGLVLGGGVGDDSEVGVLARHLLHYLHLETDATWSIATEPNLGANAVTHEIRTRTGSSWLCLLQGSADRYDALGRAVAQSIARIVDALPDDGSAATSAASLEAQLVTAFLADGAAATAGGTVGGTADGFGAPSVDGWAGGTDGRVDNRVVAYFQPIVALRTGQVVAIEALARLQTGDGVLGPDAFLEQFTSTASMLALFDRMLESALGFLHDHRHRLPDLSAAINLELAGIPGTGLASLVERRLTEFGIDADSLTIELGERLAYDLPADSVGELRRVTDLGVQLLLDDVPSSFEVLDQLVGIPVSGAKLDRRFVNQLSLGPSEIDTVRAILARAADHGIELIAEGVETQTQADRLVQLGCNFGQGYLFAVPQPAGSLSVVLEAPLAPTW